MNIVYPNQILADVLLNEFLLVDMIYWSKHLL